MKHFRTHMGGGADIPDLVLDAFGYMYLADTEEFAAQLRVNQPCRRRWAQVRS